MVKFIKINRDGKESQTATVDIVDGRVKSDPPGYLNKLLIKGEYINGKGGERISIKNPQRFLENLKYAFHGSYLWAEDV